MNTKRLGKDGPEVSAFGAGLMALSGSYGPVDDDAGIRAIRHGLDRGITFLDSADFYGMGHNERLVARALEGRRREDVVLSVKTGALRDPEGGWRGFSMKPAYLAHALAQSLHKLETDYLDFFVPSRVDPEVPIEDVVGEIARWIEKGHVRHLGLSEASAETIRRAHAVHPVSTLQIEYALVTRGIEDTVLPTCDELGITVVAYGVLCRGLLAGRIRSRDDLHARDGRGRFPRFADGNLEANLKLVDGLTGFAKARGTTPAVVAHAWAGLRENVVPLIGAKSPEQIDESLAAVDLSLSADDVAELEALVPASAVAGTRYPEHSMRLLDGGR